MQDETSAQTFQVDSFSIGLEADFPRRIVLKLASPAGEVRETKLPHGAAHNLSERLLMAKGDDVWVPEPSQGEEYGWHARFRSRGDEKQAADQLLANVARAVAGDREIL